MYKFNHFSIFKLLYNNHNNFRKFITYKGNPVICSILRQGLAHASLKLAIYGRISNSWTSCIHPPLPSDGNTQLWDTVPSYCFPHLYSWIMLLCMVLSKLWCEPVFSSLGHMPRSRHADLYLTGAFQITAAVCEGTNLSIFSPIFVICLSFVFCHCNEKKVMF